MTRLLSFLLVFFAALSANAAGSKRVALLVGNPLGGEALTPLRYVKNDLQRMHDALEVSAGFAANQIVSHFGKDARSLRESFKQFQNDSDIDLFVFYYSGHALGGMLRLGDSQMALEEVKQLIESVGAPVRIAFLDACRSASITRLKGAQKGPPIAIELDATTTRQDQSGQVIITASSDSEDAQESDEIQGSFFTYFLTSGLRGAADQNDDGLVTLSEVYTHAYTQTVSKTIGTRGGTQHPSYRFDLHGADDFVLAKVRAPESAIGFATEQSGKFIIFDRERDYVVAEFEKTPERPLIVAVAPGNYVIKKRETTHLLMQTIEVPQGSTYAVDMTLMESVDFADDYAKGAFISIEEVRYGRTGFRASIMGLTQTFLSTPYRQDFFPNLSLLQLQLQFDNLIRRNLGLHLDVGMGKSEPSGLNLYDPSVGNLDYTVNVSQLTGGVGLHYHLQPMPWMRVALQARFGLILIARSFQENAFPTQVFSTMTPGLGGDIQFKMTDWLSAGFSIRAHYMFFNVDTPQSLAFIDGGLLLTAVLR